MKQILFVLIITIDTDINTWIAIIISTGSLVNYNNYTLVSVVSSYNSLPWLTVALHAGGSINYALHPTLKLIMSRSNVSPDYLAENREHSQLECLLS